VRLLEDFFGELVNYDFTASMESDLDRIANGEQDRTDWLKGFYFGSDDHHVYALRPDGTTLWSTDVDGDVRAPLALGRDGSVLAGVFAPRPRLVALDPDTGSERWDFAVTASDSAASVTSGPLVDRDGRIYFGADDDFVYALEPGGRMRWFVRTGGNVDGEPVLAADGLLLVGSDDHRLHAIGAGPPPSP